MKKAVKLISLLIVYLFFTSCVVHMFTPKEIVINESEHGRIEVKFHEEDNEKFDLYLFPEENYTCGELQIVECSQGDIWNASVEKVLDTLYTINFSYSGKKIIITAIFIPEENVPKNETEKFYSIDFDENSNYFIKCNKTKAVQGETVTFQIISKNSKLELEEGSPFVYKDYYSDKRVSLTKSETNENEYSFIMPDSNVTIKANFVEKYAVNIIPSEHGRVETDSEKFLKNGRAEIRIYPDEGYKIKEVMYFYNNNYSTINYSYVQENYYKVVLYVPEYDLSVYVEFEEKD